MTRTIRLALWGSLLAVAAGACRNPAAPRARSATPGHLTFALDLTPPPAPTNVTAAVTRILPPNRAVVLVTWMDNSTFLDEFNTCATAVSAKGAPMGGECLYASAYDTPPGSTGVRSGSMVVGRDAAVLSLHVNRSFQDDEGGWHNVAGPESAPATITPLSHKK